MVVTWRAIENAEAYLIYKGQRPNHLEQIASLYSNEFVDTDVQTDSLYYYAVQAIDTQKQPSESRFSKIVSARPGARPALLSALSESQSSVRLRFSEPMNQSVILPTNYKLEPDVGYPSSVAHDKSGQEVVLSFDTILAVDEYDIICSGLFDVDNTPLDTLQNQRSFLVEWFQPYPYIVNANFQNATSIDLAFNQHMSQTDVEAIENYVVNDQAAVTEAQLQLSDRSIVKLTLKDLRRIAIPGDTLLLQVRNLKSADGRSIKRGRGDAIQLILPDGEAQNAQDFYVYPNPFVSGAGAMAITFANLLQNTKVQILSEHGKVIKTMNKIDSNGDLDWDLTNDSGDTVGSGVYLYRISGTEHERFGKIAVVR